MAAGFQLNASIDGVKELAGEFIASRGTRSGPGGPGHRRHHSR